MTVQGEITNPYANYNVFPADSVILCARIVISIGLIQTPRTVGVEFIFHIQIGSESSAVITTLL